MTSGQAQSNLPPVDDGPQAPGTGHQSGTNGQDQSEIFQKKDGHRSSDPGNQSFNYEDRSSDSDQHTLEFGHSSWSIRSQTQVKENRPVIPWNNKGHYSRTVHSGRVRLNLDTIQSTLHDRSRRRQKSTDYSSSSSVTSYSRSQRPVYKGRNTQGAGVEFIIITILDTTVTGRSVVKRNIMTITGDLLSPLLGGLEVNALFHVHR